MSAEIAGYSCARSHPSLALVKYWGKADNRRNLAATPSLALTLGGLTTTTEVTIIPVPSGSTAKDEVYIDQQLQNPQRYTAFFENLRQFAGQRAGIGSHYVFLVRSSSNFPSAAGLASSASGFSALALAAADALGLKPDKWELSALSRQGSASAARSLWGGFVRLDARAESAQPVHDEHWWPDIRVVVVQTSGESKKVSSRDGMERTRVSSPYYEAWVNDAPVLMERALDALERKNLPELGEIIRMSYLRMFSTMFAAAPPIIYWNSSSMAVIRRCEEMRAEGLSAWETMDAGPQVKIFCTSGEADIILKRLSDIEGLSFRVSSPGSGAAVTHR